MQKNIIIENYTLFKKKVILKCIKKLIHVLIYFSQHFPSFFAQWYRNIEEWSKKIKRNKIFRH